MDIEDRVDEFWVIQRINAPIPGELWMACHIDYDGPEDDRIFTTTSEQEAYDYAHDYEVERMVE
jgi:hypothetical protein